MSNRENFSLFFPPSSPSKSTALRQIFENLPSHSSRVAHALLRKVSTQGINNTSLIVSIRIFARRILLPARSYCGSTMPASISLRLLSFFIIKGRAARPAARPNELPVCPNYAYVASLHVASFSLPDLIADRRCLPPFRFVFFLFRARAAPQRATRLP